MPKKSKGLGNLTLSYNNFYSHSSHNDIGMIFILDQPTLDVPPPGWTATVSHRPVSGILRVTVPPRLTTIKVDRITVQVSGLTNGERDGKYDSLSDLNSPFLAGNRKLKNRKRERSGRCEMEMTVNETVVVWKPADLDQFEEGLVSGIHDFPFSILIPMAISPTYSLKIFSSYPDSTLATSESRSYELTASIYRQNVINNSNIHLANCPVVVRNAFPKWQLSEDPNRIGRGRTFKGEFKVTLTVPRLAFIQDQHANFSLVIADGHISIKNITSFKCFITETASYKSRNISHNQAFSYSSCPSPYHQQLHHSLPKKNLGKPIPMGSYYHYKLNPSDDRYKILGNVSNPYKFSMSIKEFGVDVSTSNVNLVHAVVIWIEYLTDEGIMAYAAVQSLTPGGAHSMNVNNNNSDQSIVGDIVAGVGIGTGTRVFDEHTDLIVPRGGWMGSVRESVTRGGVGIIQIDDSDSDKGTGGGSGSGSRGSVLGVDKNGHGSGGGLIKGLGSGVVIGPVEKLPKSPLFTHAVAGIVIPLRIVNASVAGDEAMLAIFPLEAGYSKSGASRVGGDGGERSGDGWSVGETVGSWAIDAAEIVARRFEGGAGSDPHIQNAEPSSFNSHVPGGVVSNSYNGNEVGLTHIVSLEGDLDKDGDFDDGELILRDNVKDIVIHEPVDRPRRVVVGYNPVDVVAEINGNKISTENQLKMNAGDHVLVKEKYENGWALGTNLISSATGLFPLSSVEFSDISEDDDDHNEDIKKVPVNSNLTITTNVSPLDLGIRNETNQYQNSNSYDPSLSGIAGVSSYVFPCNTSVVEVGGGGGIGGMATVVREDSIMQRLELQKQLEEMRVMMEKMQATLQALDKK